MAASTKNPAVSQTENTDTNETVTVQEKILYTWKAPARFFKKRTKEFWTKTGLAASLFAVILYISEGVMPVLLLIALFFLFYVLSTVEPENIEYRITNLGVYISNEKINYPEILRFWIVKETENTLLYFDLMRIPGTINIVINKNDIEKIRNSLSKYVVEEVPQLTNTEKVSHWVSQKLQ